MDGKTIQPSIVVGLVSGNDIGPGDMVGPRPALNAGKELEFCRDTGNR